MKTRESGMPGEPMWVGEAWRVLHPGGVLAIVHWTCDAPTPRGPDMDIRPRPEQCRGWAESAGFTLAGPACIDLPPHHYGLMMAKPGAGA